MEKSINKDVVYRAAKPKDKTYKISDGGGLSLVVKADGTKRWTYRYLFNDKPNELGFGIYPATTLENARRQAALARQQIAQGVDPAEQRKRLKAEQKAKKDIETKQKQAVNQISAEITQQVVNSIAPITNIIEFKVTVEVVRWQ